jgi:hypothetical protein
MNIYLTGCAEHYVSKELLSTYKRYRRGSLRPQLYTSLSGIMPRLICNLRRLYHIHMRVVNNELTYTTASIKTLNKEVI